MPASTLDAAILACLHESVAKLCPLIENRYGCLHFGPFGREMTIVSAKVEKSVIKLRIPNYQGWDICVEGLEDPGYFDGMAEKMVDYCKRVVPGTW